MFKCFLFEQGSKTREVILYVGMENSNLTSVPMQLNFFGFHHDTPKKSVAAA